MEYILPYEVPYTKYNSGQSAWNQIFTHWESVYRWLLRQIVLFRLSAHLVSGSDSVSTAVSLE